MIYALPFIAAITGWITNLIAVKMLFYPKKPIRILGITIQGVFPKRQLVLAEKLGNIVANELFSIDEVLVKLKNEDSQKKAMGFVETKIDDFINLKLPAQMPMLAMFLSADMKVKIKTTLLDEITNVIPGVIDSFANDIKENIDVKAIVYEKVAQFSADKFEDILFSIMKKEFKLIEILGGVLGFIIGIIQLLLVILA
jgi:uncharacterized membrane protein YheB (UPF0754 family)